MERNQKHEQVWQRVQAEAAQPDYRWIPEMIAEEKAGGAI